MFAAMHSHTNARVLRWLLFRCFCLSFLHDSCPLFRCLFLAKRLLFICSLSAIGVYLLYIYIYIYMQLHIYLLYMKYIYMHLTYMSELSELMEFCIDAVGQTQVLKFLCDFCWVCGVCIWYLCICICIFVFLYLCFTSKFLCDPRWVRGTHCDLPFASVQSFVSLGFLSDQGLFYINLFVNEAFFASPC